MAYMFLHLWVKKCCFVLVYFYNFRWNDYGVASLMTILDMVKVMSFAIQEGKMAVHCHAGLGRTGIVLFSFTKSICIVATLVSDAVGNTLGVALDFCS